MTVSNDLDTRDLLKKAYLEIRALRSRIAESEDARREPVAIIGLGCRFPAGAVDAESLWRVLHDGVDAVGLVPRERWDTEALFDPDPDAPGKLYTRHGAFVEGVDQFDAALFGISPVEASAMDPQQRLLLEVAWEALENAGIAPDALRATRTGVFVGLMYQDYLARQIRETGNDGIGPYLGVGSTFSAAAGRLSYVLGLQGPSIAVDTACSSSLVAVHLACQALRNRECDVALAGGANVMLTPEASINLSKARMLSPTGRCRTFDAAADGFIRGEGGGLIVLKRLSDARADGDRILGLVRGSAVNQDGRSNGLTAPNGSAQRVLLREALAAAGATADDVEYVECHGTGTPLGDPIEVGALLDVYGDRSREKPLAIGSVKTNFGHLESAAGICGLLKSLLVLRNREIPPHLHLATLNPHIHIDSKPVVIPTSPTPWFRGEKRLAAVSAFGFVGTNAHVILEAFDEAPMAETPRGAHVLTLSAASEPALHALRERFVAHLQTTSDALGDVCFTANTGRAHLAHRVAAVARDHGTMAARLRDAPVHRIADGTPRVAFLFTGQGSQAPGAGRRLHETEATFRDAIERCDAILRSHLDVALPSLLFGDDTPLLDQTRFAQPAIVALEIALFEQWRAWGIEPSILIGHSIGDYAVAVARGELTLEQALTIVAERGRLMQALPAGGGMAAVFASEEWAQERIAKYPDTLSVAAVNAQSEVVLSGRLDHLRDVLGDVDARELNVSHAFHSPLMRPMLDDFARVLEGVPNAARWLEHVVAPVRFRDAVEALRARGDELLLELGPRPVLAPLAARALPGVTALSSLRPDRDAVEQTLECLGALHVRGVRVRWSAFPGRKVTVPSYAFQRERYWFKPSQQPFLTRLPQTANAPGTFVWAVDTKRPFLFEHRLLGTEVWPISAQIAVLFEAAREVFGDEQCEIREIEFRETLFAGAAHVQVVLGSEEEGSAALRVYSRPSEDEPWVLNTTARAELARNARPVRVKESSSTQPVLSMMFFAAKEEDDDRYRLIIEAARFADRNGFRGVWVPERHFTHMGSLYPSPSVLHAALARETKHVRLMAGSVVVPLHHVARIAEEWAMVDNLSGGRVGISLASGWNPDDFVLAPEKYEERYRELYDGIALLRRLWRGESFEGSAPNGRVVSLRTYPTPVQRELPLWITAARSVESFQRAGALGANLLTHLLDQDVETLARKIALYRAARAEHGFDPETGVVSVMCHTFVAPDLATAHRLAKQPFCEYLKASMPLLAGLATSRGKDIDVHKLSGAELDEFVEFLYERFSTTRALIGTPDTCRPLIDALQVAGVNEIACLLDFGPSTDEVLEHLPLLATLQQQRPEAILVAPGGRKPPNPDSFQRVDVPSFYDSLAAAGIDFTGSLRGLTSLAVGDREALATVAASGEESVVLDACLQSALAALPREDGAPIRVPTGVRAIRVHRRPTGGLVAHGRVDVPHVDGSIDGDVTVFDEHGQVVLEIEGLHVRSLVTPARLAKAGRVDDAWFYEVAWPELPWRDTKEASRPWIILEDTAGVGRAFASRRFGAPHVFVQPGAITEQVGPAQWTVDPNDGFPRLLRQLDLAAYEGILSLWPLHPSTHIAEDQRFGIEAMTSLVQAIAQPRNAGAPAGWPGGALAAVIPPLWLVTRNAQATRNERVEVSQSTLWGFAGAVVREHPEWWGGIIDLDANAGAEALDRALRCDDGEDQIAIRDGRRFARRLVRSSAPRHEASFRDDATYLVAGGAGGLGLEVARWMIERGARHLILAGRSKTVELPPLGPHVSYVALDIADEGQVAAFLASYEGPPLRGVIHAAGVFRDESLLHLDREGLWDVLRAKVSGAWALHCATRERELDFFVMFSSFSAITPPHGQAAYAAASAFLDSLAHARRAEGLPALSINWGAWSDVGFAATAYGAEAHARLEAMGMKRMTPVEGLAALERLFAPQMPPQMAVFPMDVRMLTALDSGIAHAPLMRELARTETPHAEPRAAEASLDAIRAMDAGAQRALLEEQVARIVSSILEIPSARLEIRTPLTQLGLDSLIAVQLKNRLQKDVGLTVPLVNALRGGSVASLVDDLLVDLRLGSMRGVVEAGAHQELEL